MDQLGLTLPRIIEAMAFAPKPKHRGKIMMSKLDIKDDFWCMVCEAGQEWNFAYILPDTPRETVEIVVPLALQMG